MIRYLIAAFLIGAVLIFMQMRKQPLDSQNPLPTKPPESITTPSLLQDEKQKIDAWIRQNNLNTYGDPKDTMYAGGTPLFDEATGQTTDRYEYILKRHPSRPWNK